MSDTPPNSPTAREAAAQAVVADPVTANLLAKHSAGEKLTQKEYGKIGAWARLKNFVSPQAKPGNGAAQPGPGAAPGVGTGAPGQASADSLPVVPVDPGLARRTTASIIKRCDALTRNWVEGHAERAGATGPVLARFRSAAGLPAADQELLADLSPDILAELGVDPRQYPILTASAVLGVHLTGLMLAVNELKQLQHTQRVEKLKEQGKATQAVSTPTPPNVTRPSDPPGTTKVFCDESAPKNSMGPFDEKRNQNP